MNVIKKGFTLAEVLIVIGIIGVIGALTIPTLMQNIYEKQTATRLKKVYSTLENAYKSAYAENGPTMQWGLTSGTAGEAYMQILSQYLKGTYCGTAACDSRLKTYYYQTGAGFFNSNSATNAKILLPDGMVVYGTGVDVTCGPLYKERICSVMYVDVNYDKGANKAKDVLGVGLFSFYLSVDRILPVGGPNESWPSFKTECNVNSSGKGCTAWLIYNENMDYLKCPEILSWKGPFTCN